MVGLWRWTLALSTLAAALAGGLLAAWLAEATWVVLRVVGAVLATGAAAVVGWPPARYRAWGFQLRDADVRVRRGVLWRTVSVVPHARIQHVDTRRGPLERRVGLARLVIYTAGTRGASVPILGLDEEAAERLREELATTSGLEDAV